MSAIAAIVGTGTLTVTGHSLGSPLATYLAYDLGIALPGQVSLRVFASPHLGDLTFVDAVVPNHVHYAVRGDIVPQVPAGLGYAHLPNTVMLDPTTEWVQIHMSRDCLHHVMSYAAVLDPDILKQDVPAQDRSYAACISVRGVEAA